ncbi:helix-turn-helix domain-containing protein [Rothia sp. P5764]|uniref:helix-turn-helix domain-containing protein n=1 Tax=Rothia sp. P5764 TaxID=3402654 RepID=UPI003AC05FED
MLQNFGTTDIVLGMTYVEQIAGNVRAEMGRRHITQKELAPQIGISQVQLSSRLNCRVEFKPSELEKIAELFELPVSVLTAPTSLSPEVV